MNKKKAIIVAVGAAVLLLLVVFAVLFNGEAPDSPNQEIGEINDRNIEVVDESEVGGSWDDSASAEASKNGSANAGSSDSSSKLGGSSVAPNVKGSDFSDSGKSNEFVSGSSSNKDNAAGNNGNGGGNSAGGNGSSGNGSGNGGGVPSSGGVTYAEYMAMTPAQQQSFFESFDSVADFRSWYNNAKAEHDANDNSIEINGGNVDLGDIVNGNK